MLNDVEGPMQAKPLVFVSHISEDEAVAEWLKTTLNRDFLRLLEVFVSSDTESIEVGTPWFDSVRQALADARVLIVLCSRASVGKPWINFEVGAAWIINKPIIPLCHSGLSPAELPMPLSLRQGIELHDPEGIERLYEGLAREFGFGIPEKDFAELAGRVPSVPDSEADELAEPADDPHISRRLRAALEGSKYKWRSLEWAAVEAGVSEETAADVLRRDDEVRFSKSKTNRTIVGLVSRVGG
jgi:TIR domain